MRLYSKFSLFVVIFSAQITAQVIFSEGFEGSTSGWTVSPTANGWQFGTPGAGPASTPEGVRCAGTVLNGQYIDNTTYTLTSPSITIPAQNFFNLSFYQWLSTEQNYDYTHLEIEQNGSGTWTVLDSTSISNTTWQLREYNLDSYRNSTIRLRFRFTTDRSNTNYGWYIDNIRISQIPSVNLTVQNGPNGSTAPSGTLAIRSNTSSSINATPNTNYRLDKWSILSGTPVIADSFSTSTTVTLSSDATIRATFKPCSVYTITSTPNQYNYNQNYFTSAANGVRLKITAPISGTFRINLQNISSHSNYIYYYGRDSLFNSYVNTYSNSSTSTITITITANAGENHYFRVYPSSSTYNNSIFSVFYLPPVSLTITNDGNGSTTPTGTTSVISGVATSISATPTSGYRFNKWSNISGNVSFADSFSTSTNLTTSTDATIRATFKPCSIYTITQTQTQYNYTQHYYSGSQLTGVRFQFTASSTGNYSVNLTNLLSHSNYLYYYGTSSTFTSTIQTASNMTNTSIAFYAIANQTHYFMVYTSSSAYFNYNFNINYSSGPSLTINNDGNGTTSPAGNTAFVPGSPLSISASATTGFRLNKWIIESGSPVFADSFSTPTTVTTSSSAIIRATFKPCSIYTITQTPKQYNYTQHYYSESPSTGVRFQFTTSSAGNYSINLQNLLTHSSYMYYYGTSPTFTSALQTVSNTTNTSIAFHSNANETHYFMVGTSSSYYNNNFNIAYSNALSLTVNNDGNGSTTPSGNTAITPNFATSITATPNPGYRFNKWSIISGSPVFSDSFSTPATVTTSTDATIRANFKPCSVYTITSTPRQYNYNQNYYTSSSDGVRFKFTAPISGTLRITLQNISSHSNYIYYYGRDSLFNSYVNTYSNSSTSTITITITANAGENHYFRVYPSNSTYNNSTFSIFYSPPLALTISKSGSGWTSPSGTVGVISGVATSISAVPSGGYLFQNWTVVRGNPTIANAASATTTVTATTDSSEIRANFIINPNTRPNTQISDINISSHPDICLTASVTDSAGRSIIGLDTSNFILTQDSDTVPYQLTTVANVTGVSVALVIDRSGSMANNQKITDALNAARQYVATMNPFDRCAIVSFGESAWLEQSATSDTTLLNRAINSITANSGDTKIITGTVMGIGQLLQETNTRTVIVFSDGINGTDISLQSAVDSAHHNNISIYSIGIGSSADRTVLGALADSTGGYYTASPTAAGLASIYAQIKSDVQAQYILCYQTPDAIFNGDTHQVVLSVNLNNRTAKDTVYWNENNTPPVITLTSQTAAMIGINQSPNQPLTISADVTDDGSVQLVRLFYRRSNTTAGTYTEAVMTHGSGSLYQYTIPAAQIISPGIDFYILATDNYHLIGRSPNVLAPETQPYVIPVGNDVPVISYTPPNCAIPATNLTITPTITDQNGISIALLYFKRSNETFYTIDTMNLTGTDIYSGTVPGSMVSTNGIDYYFRAIDSRGAAVRHPRSGSIHLSLCNNVNPPVANAGLDTTLFTNSNSCVVSATLNGTGSTNPDGGTLTYSWTVPFTGTVTGATPSVNLDVGANQIILSVTNNGGATDLDTVIITVRDTFPPTPNQSSLANITAQCSITLTPPTATDNCGAIINGTTATTTFNTQGIFDIEWVFRDSSGNTSSQSQRVIIDDNTPPVPQRSTLPAITGNCSSGIITAPTAIDSCSTGIITATTTDPLVYDQPGIYTITWRYTDTKGNSSTQAQSVVISDLTPPVPIQTNLPVLSSTCSLTVTTIPTAFDSCTQKIIIGSTTDSLTYNKPGIDTITWTYTDSSGNTSSQKQQVSIIDTIAPVPNKPVLDTIRGECTATVADTPTATDNFCGIIRGATSDPLTYSTEGTHTITWNYTDKSGNTSTQTQLVIIDDVTPPDPLKASLPDIQNECSVSITDHPQASDNCGTIITATTTSPLTYNNQGRYTITWTYDDGNGNTVTQDQKVIIEDSTPPVFSTLSDKVLKIKSTASGANIPIETAHATDNCTQVSVQGIRSDSLRLDTLYFEGATRITWTACDTNANCSSASQTIKVIRNQAPVLQIPADTSLSEGEIVDLSFAASDSDGTTPSLFIDSLAFPFVFRDSANGHATLSLRPGCTGHGVYTVKVHASDSIDTITREFVVTIKDINYPPEFDTTTSYYVAHEMVEFKTTIKVYDCDNPNPKIRIVNAPRGAQFIDNNNGTGTFTWTPGGSDNGFYMVIFEAQDDMTTVRDTIIIEITDVNAYPPEITVSVSDTTVSLNLPVVIYATAKDRDGTPTYIRASGLPSGALFESDDNGTALVRWTPADTGIFTFSFIAIDAADTTVKVSKDVQLKVSNINVTGPEFSPVQNFIIDQNKQFTTILEAHDPDGTIPVLRLKSGQQGDLTFTDNGNGTATLSWMPACNVSGTFYLTATASDQSFTDSVTFAITVRDVNCPPVLFRISDINAQAGEMVRILVRAYDPDGDTVVPTLSVGCTLPGHTFTSSGNGTGTFRWQAIYNTGSYPVTFYASDGIATDSFTMHININKTGNVKILSTTSGSTIFVMPAGPYNGEFLGTDSVTMSMAPGIYHFEVQKKGYRSEQFSVKVFADSSVEKVCSLKVSIPLMTSLLDTSFISQDLSPSHFPSSFTDINYDGYIDYTVLSDSGIKVFPGLDSSGLKYDSKSYILADSIPASAVHYEFVDWNDDKTLDCIYSDLAGNIIVANFRIGTFETVVTLPGSKIFFSVLDINNDHRKDLIVHSEGAGFSVYLNQGDDKSPLFTASHQIAITSGQLPANLHGAFTFIDIDGNGISELLIKNEKSPALFKIDSSFTEMSYIDDLNCAGKRIASDTLTICQFGSPCNLPRIILKTAAHSLLFRTHLLGDVNNDNKVDIRDISKISRLWEITDTDASWDPECNLRLSRSGQEKIDIRDISSASKSWELQQ